jgi:hypothetical protein
MAKSLSNIERFDGKELRGRAVPCLFYGYNGCEALARAEQAREILYIPGSSTTLHQTPFILNSKITIQRLMEVNGRWLRPRR